MPENAKFWLENSLKHNRKCPKTVNLTIHPAPINHGIKFVRTDLPECPSISAHFNMVVDTSLATVIGYDGFIVSTIEHLMACLAGLSIDNALIELDAYEVPVMDGSAGPFAHMIMDAGIAQQDAAPQIHDGLGVVGHFHADRRESARAVVRRVARQQDERDEFTSHVVLLFTVRDPFA